MAQDPTDLRSDVTIADHVADLELPPGRELDVVTNAAGEPLILTTDEARLYGQAAAQAREVEGGDGDVVATALERLGRLRGRRLEELARPDVDVDELRAKLLRALELGVVDLAADVDLEDHKRAVGRVSASARALDALGTPLESIPAQTGRLELAGPIVDDVATRRLAGHVYQAVSGAGHQGEAAEAAREAVIAGVAELSEERQA